MEILVILGYFLHKWTSLTQKAFLREKNVFTIVFLLKIQINVITLRYVKNTCFRVGSLLHLC